MRITDDPIMDALRYIDDQEERIEKLPVCDECGEHIQQEYAVRIDGKWYCDECIEKFRVETEEW